MSEQDVDQPSPALPYNDAVQLAWAALQRYAGWLGHDVASKRARAAVNALGLVLDQQGGPDATAVAIAKVTSEVERLEAVDLQPLFRRALHDLRAGLDSPEGEP